jgi:diguanylate cyclase (GGDEF)-like protein
MFLDLDDFKWVNDTLGHNAGDDLLREVGVRLGRCVRGVDGVGRNAQASIARLGGDEFTVIVTDLDQAADADRVAQRILDAMAVPFSLSGEDIFASVSIGIALYPDDAADIDSLLMSADAAMYRAKAAGRNNYRSFDVSMQDHARRNLSYGTQLRHALERDELRLQYQPKMTVAAGHLTGVEALVRWMHPDGRLMAPGDFLPIAEHTGLIVPIGEWAIGAALAQLRTWQDGGFPVMRVALNLSSRQLRERDFADRVMQLLDRHRLPPSSLELEITESSVMEESEACVNTLNRLSAIGVEFAIDHFGTGASSLSFLKRLPLKAIKIDRAFIQNITQDRDDAKIVRAIVGLGHNLGLVVVAEGVETLGQLEILAKFGCDQYQGRLFSGAVDAARIAALLDESERSPLAGGVGARDVR